jgi:hypothetical protein
LYKIKYHYETGNSFGRHDEENVLEYEWEDLNVAKEALRRIEEHYKWYQNVEHYSRRFFKIIEKPKWHNVKSKYITKDMEHNLLNIPMDNGEEIQFWPPWCGYFETLYGASIVVEDKGLSFTIH